MYASALPSRRWNPDQHCFTPDSDVWGNASVEGLMVGGMERASAARWRPRRLAGLDAARAVYCTHSEATFS